MHYNNQLKKTRNRNTISACLCVLFLNIMKMIRRIFSTFIEYPNQNVPSLNPDFFNQGGGLTTTTFKEHYLDPFNWLHDTAPVFPVQANKIKVIKEPKEFYETVLNKSKNAKDRITLVSLYLGIGNLEKNLVNAIHCNLQRNMNLKVNILLDYTRGTRGKENSKSMLMPLIQENSNCHLSLYHTPALRGITKKLAPARWNELLGLQHMKLYLFDDTVIISGANLSNDYFTNRQDRYIMIENLQLADFFFNFVSKVQEFSLKVQKNGNINLHENWKLWPYESTRSGFANEAKSRINTFFRNTFETQKKHLENANDNDTWIFPTIEMGQLNIHHDSYLSKNLIVSAPKNSNLKMSTGYFNLTENLMNSIVKDCEANCSIIMAHPNANGFIGAKGPAGGIPAAYSLLARKFYDQIKKFGEENRISLMEYERLNWSYHAKGVWYYPEKSSRPCITLIGSSNYGERSVNRDLEAQVCIVTTNKKLQSDLNEEYNHLTNYSTTAENQLVSRYIPNWVKTVVWLFKNFF